MDIDLTAVKGALTGLSDTEARALIAATYGVPQIAPGLLAWIDSACDWELNRRGGSDYPLQPPEAAIDALSSALYVLPVAPGASMTSRVRARPDQRTKEFHEVLSCAS